MRRISADTTLEELAAVLSQALDRAGITATLSGGAAVSLYSANEYESTDLDFVTSARLEIIGDAIAPLGFHRVGKARQFEHPDAVWYVEFPPGPIGFGETNVAEEDVGVLDTPFGPLRVVTPTQCVMDRLAAYSHWSDRQSLDQAVMVARHQDVDWSALKEWASGEGMDAAVVERLKRRAAPEVPRG